MSDALSEAIKNVRAVVFGMRADGRVQRVAPVRNLTIEDAGLYIHVQDIDKYLEFQEKYAQKQENENDPNLS